MRVALLTDDWRPSGGVASHVRLVAPALAAAGHQVLVIHAGVQNQPGPAHPQLVVRAVADAFYDAGDARNVAAIGPVIESLRAFGPDVTHIHANQNLPLEDAVRAQWPMLRTLHTLEPCPAGTKLHAVSGHECRFDVGPLCLPRMVYLRCLRSKRPAVIWRHFDRARALNRRLPAYPRILTASRYVQRLAVSVGVPEDRVTVLPYFLGPADAESAPVPAPQGRTVLFVGRVVYEKGLDLLVQALRRAGGDWRLVVVGDGMAAAGIRRDLDQSPDRDRVEWRGWLDADAIRREYDQANVVAVPSRWPEPFGIVGIEAMARGRPVIAFSTGGIPEWLGDADGGWLVRPGDIDGLAVALRRALDDPDESARVAAVGRIRARATYGAQAHVQRLGELYAAQAAAGSHA